MFRSAKNEILEAIQSRRSFIPSDSVTLACPDLAQALNQLLEDYCEAEDRRYGKDSVIKQLEVALMNLNESVLLIDQSRTVRFVNDASKSWLSYRSGNIIGRSIEDVFRSAELIEFVYALIQGQLGQKGQQIVRIQRNGNGVRWFEVTGASIKENDGGKIFLLVMHDITQLKALEAVRKDFVANVSHELRTPVTVIKGFTETLAEEGDELPPALRNKFIDKTHRNVQRLNDLIEDLLILSRLESGAHQEKKEVFDLNEICSEVAENFNLQKTNYEIPIIFEDCKTEAWIEADRNQCIQILENLIDNCYRYAGNFTEIVIRLGEVKQGDQVFWRCEVQDDGVGIPVQSQSRVFERFYRVDKSRSTQSGGTGLGLSIVKHIVQLHGGTVSVSTPEGGGTSVMVLFPKYDEGKLLKQ